MRVLFLGTSEFAVPTLTALACGSAHEVLAVVSQPDRPQGRGRQVGASPVVRAAHGLGLPLLQPRRVRSRAFIDRVRDLAPDALVLAAFGQLIPQELLDIPPMGPINVHGSLLPAYRGAAPIQHAVLNGEYRTGVTTMWMDASLDTGDILLARAIEVAPDETAGELTTRLACLGAETLVETLDRLAAGTCPRVPQDHSRATWAPALDADDGRLRWDEPARRTVNRVLAMTPRPGAFTTLGPRRVKVWRAAVAGDACGPGEPGVVVGVAADGVDLLTPEGVVRLVEVQQEGARRMPAADWARGARVRPGDRLGA